MKKIILLSIALATMIGCSKELGSNGMVGEPQTIKVNVASFDGGLDTRTTVTPEGNFAWSAGDEIGIYPLSVAESQSSQQIIFRISSAASAESATFTGTGWGLITNGTYSYFSYYPYKATTTHDTATVSYTDNLNQASNTSTAHLGVNDFLYAPSIKPTSIESAELIFYHISALVQFEITVPKECENEYFKSVTISSDEDLFTVSGNYNPSTTVTRDPEHGVYGPALTNKVYTNTMSLSLNGDTGIQPVNGKINAYFLMAPADVAGKQLRIEATYANGGKLIGTKQPSSNIESQSHHVYSCDVSVSITDLSSNGTANCYIVTKPGEYKFLANVKGNGIDVDGSAASPITGMDHAAVVWETQNSDAAPGVNSIVSSVEYSNNYIKFCVPSPRKAGNAVIAIKDASNNILWSWHIWVPESNVGSYEGDDITIMDRLLGALSKSYSEYNTNDFGCFYHWGVKNPIPPTTSRTNVVNQTMPLAAVSGTQINRDTSNVYSFNNFVSNPECLYYLHGNDYNIPSQFINNWCASDETGKKTMYDPSPVGWRVPKYAQAVNVKAILDTATKESYGFKLGNDALFSYEGWMRPDDNTTQYKAESAACWVGDVENSKPAWWFSFTNEGTGLKNDYGIKEYKFCILCVEDDTVYTPKTDAQPEGSSSSPIATLELSEW